MDNHVNYDVSRYMSCEHFFWCEVKIANRWQTQVWQPRVATGDYLNNEGGVPRLMCGIYDICTDLGLPEPSDPKALLVSELVDRQLLQRPWAMLKCPEFHVFVKLLERVG